MRRTGLFGLVLVAALGSGISLAQIPNYVPMQGEQVPADAALDRALKTSSLTFEGKPFHAVMEIGTAGTTYSGRVELWWVSATKYRLVMSSPKFSQSKIVNGDRVAEKDEGDYYPRWLENFVQALIDPVPMAKNFRGRGGSVMLAPQRTRSCLERNDRPGGITDQMTWGQICFSGAEPRLAEILTFNDSMTFSDWKGFGKKQIARRYETEVLAYQPIVGKLSTLEELKKPDEDMFTFAEVTPAEKRISTAFVSTLKEESLVDNAPVIEWPTVREGKTEGYMIVYARTDRTGQVREAAKHNSDQPGLESFGMEQALKYKFKPLLVDGVAQQMEMPLVLHFSSKLANPIPILSVAEMKKQIIECNVGSVPPGTPKGTVITMLVSVNEAGKVTGLSGPRLSFGTADTTTWQPVIIRMFKTCKLAPYIVNGAATYYKGDLEWIAP